MLWEIVFPGRFVEAKRDNAGYVKMKGAVIRHNTITKKAANVEAGHCFLLSVGAAGEFTNNAAENVTVAGNGIAVAVAEGGNAAITVNNGESFAGETAVNGFVGAEIEAAGH